MVRLIDRFTGQILGTIIQADLDALQAALVSESEDDADFYLTLDVLDTLQSKGMSESSLAILRDVLTARGDLDLGWEPILESPVTRLTGSCVSPYGPLPGLRAELTLEDQGEELGRAFTRPDGHFELLLAGPLPANALITMMALGDSPLVDLELDGPDVGLVELPALRGRLVNQGNPVAGVMVDATIVDGDLEFSTWTISDAAGQFVIPYPPVSSDRPGDGKLELDLTAPSGQSLGASVRRGPLAHPELGDWECDAPDPDWQPSEEARESVERPLDPVYPGVKSHPLA